MSVLISNYLLTRKKTNFVAEICKTSKTRLNDLSYGIKNLDVSFFRYVTMHAFDGQTDGHTDRRTAFSSLDRVCISCSAVKIKHQCIKSQSHSIQDKMLSYRRETALQGAL